MNKYMKILLSKIIFIVFSILTHNVGLADESIKYVIIMNDGLSVVIPIVPPHLPPDPGEGAHLTIEGVDANTNGIRDDIERFIAFEHIGDENSSLRESLYKFAYWQQRAVVLSNFVNKEIARELVEASRCVEKISKNYGYQTYAEIIALHLNTYDRSVNYMRYLEKVHSLSWGGDASDNPLCEF